MTGDCCVFKFLPCSVEGALIIVHTVSVEEERMPRRKEGKKISS